MKLALATILLLLCDLATGAMVNHHERPEMEQPQEVSL
jgi:hypothetical protein